MNTKIIIAEDSSVIQNLTKRILSMQSYEITAVKNGVEVLQHIEKEKFDLALLDIHMPKMDGMECARKIRELETSGNKMPIIAITGNAKNYSIEDFNEAGIDDYLPKPLNYDDMIRMVKKYTEG
ncbi:MAG: response regulator [Cyclobacteriaceae bacterium]|nr:response regulator [Cyclobacteriaceae bacterium HetDA_MAG_MS6]